MAERDSPSLAALFLVVFDQKIGYKIAWQKCKDGIDLSGVEYKSLPSGLHEQTSDVVYFKHGQHAGLGAFARAKSDDAHRNAQFTVVGALSEVVDDHGMAWQHAQILGDLAQKITADSDDHSSLEQHWAKNALRPLKHNSSIEDADDHPARTLKHTLDLFGPLLLPLQRQVLLCKRILVAGQPPVLDICRVAYALAALSSARKSTALYSVGISDIPTLENTPDYIACTTDAILKDKTNLYDVLVSLKQGETPRINDAAGIEIRATQRDLRRYQALQGELQQTVPTEVYTDEHEDEQILLEQTSTGPVPYDLSAVEPYTWTSVAIRSLSWLQNPDELNAAIHEEAEIDTDLLKGLSGVAHNTSVAQALVIMEYFQRSSKLLLDQAEHVVDGAEHDSIQVQPIALTHAGLDAWSEVDRTYFEALLRYVSGKQAKVVDDPITLCGLRVC